MVKVNWCLDTVDQGIVQASPSHLQIETLSRDSASAFKPVPYTVDIFIRLELDSGWFSVHPFTNWHPYSVGQELQLSLVRKMASPCPAVQYTP